MVVAQITQHSPSTSDRGKKKLARPLTGIRAILTDIKRGEQWQSGTLGGSRMAAEAEEKARIRELVENWVLWRDQGD
jgi:hypothetical protein